MPITKKRKATKNQLVKSKDLKIKAFKGLNDKQLDLLFDTFREAFERRGLQQKKASIIVIKKHFPDFNNGNLYRVAKQLLKMPQIEAIMKEVTTEMVKRSNISLRWVEERMIDLLDEGNEVHKLNVLKEIAKLNSIGGRELVEVNNRSIVVIREGQHK